MYTVNSDEDDDSSVTTMGDELSVDLLAPPTEPTIKNDRKDHDANSFTKGSKEDESKVKLPQENDAEKISCAKIMASLSGGNSDSIPSPVSPATQTLDILSGIDIQKGGDLHYDMSQLSKIKENRKQGSSKNLSNKTFSSSKKNNNNNMPTTKKRKGNQDQSYRTVQEREGGNNHNHKKISQENYSYHSISLNEIGPLGICVDNDVIDSSGKTSCAVREVKKGSQAHRMGIKVKDIICHVKKQRQIIEEPFQEASLKEVLEWASSPKRPIQFVVKRRLVPSDNNNNDKSKTKGTITTKQNNADPKKVKLSSQITSTVDTNPLQEKKTTKNGSTNKRVKESDIIGNYPIFSFCKKCSRSSSNDNSKLVYHHSLCPKHHEFKQSGAKERLFKLMKGSENGCKACEYNLKFGKLSRKLSHSSQCELRKNTDSNKTLSQHGDHENKNELKKDATKQCKDNCKTKKKATTKNVKSSNNSIQDDKVTQQEIGDKSIATQENNHGTLDNGARYINKMVRKDDHSIEKLSQAGTSNILVTKTERCKIQSPCLIHENKVGGAKDNVNRHVQKNVYKRQLILADDLARPSWVASPNPWGSMHHHENDYVLFSPTTYRLLVEGQGFLPPRFVINPFCPNLDYHKSHKTPDNGFSLIRLTRDRLSLRSWGFTFRAHEFGGACLIESIDFMSPAHAAVSFRN